MQHLGDITKIDWSQVESVDVVTGGSPCQDLSISGKRAGLASERSGLFMEQIRCVKELRKADELRGRTGVAIRPRFMVWENVPGAFNSGNPKGADFATVIEEIIKVVEPQAPVMPVPENGWPASGCLYDELGRWSVAWRVHDAQFWGVPQRRRRIALVADFGGLAAPEVLFERKGLSGDFEQGGTQREEAAGEIGASAYPTVAGSLTLRHDGSGVLTEPMYSLNTVERHAVCAGFLAGQGEKARSIGYQEECAPSLKAGNSGTNRTPTICIEMTSTHNTVIDNEICPTLTARMGTGGNQVNAVLETCKSYVMQGFGDYKRSEVSSGCKARDYKDATELIVKHTVRRLTPLECERLQGFPDGWTDIGDWVDSRGKKRKIADSPRYKALGNSIALPFWKWLLKRISAQYERDATLGSLFDGIGGFPLVWEQINGKGSARWASEIEEFPIAVTKLRFGDGSACAKEGSNANQHSLQHGLHGGYAEDAR